MRDNGLVGPGGQSLGTKQPIPINFIAPVPHEAVNVQGKRMALQMTLREYAAVAVYPFCLEDAMRFEANRKPNTIPDLDDVVRDAADTAALAAEALVARLSETTDGTDDTDRKQV